MTRGIDKIEYDLKHFLKHFGFTNEKIELMLRPYRDDRVERIKIARQNKQIDRYR